MMEDIKQFDGKYRFLSNFDERSVRYGGLTYENSEAAFHAQKCTGLKAKRAFCKLNPSEAKKLGRKVTLPADWEIRKFDEMFGIDLSKFLQHKDLADLLIATGDANLIEGNIWHDKCWGVCLYTGEGANNLGKILMKIRQVINILNDWNAYTKNLKEFAKNNKDDNIIITAKEFFLLNNVYRDIDDIIDILSDNGCL